MINEQMQHMVDDEVDILTGLLVCLEHPQKGVEFGRLVLEAIFNLGHEHCSVALARLLRNARGTWRVRDASPSKHFVVTVA
jgi:hypothetical protein